MQHVTEWSGRMQIPLFSKVLWCLKYSRITLLIVFKSSDSAVASEFLFKNRLVTRCQVLHFAVMEAARLQDGNLASTVERFWDRSWRPSWAFASERYPFIGIHFNFLSISKFTAFCKWRRLWFSVIDLCHYCFLLICVSTRKFAANTPKLFLHMDPHAHHFLL